MNKDILEELAEIEHQQWCHWIKYMLWNYTPNNIQKWERQCNTNYNELSEKEKESDRVWARRVFTLIHNQANKEIENGN